MAARDICMYDTCVKLALGPITLRACANGAKSAIFEINFYRERKLWKKNISCSLFIAGHMTSDQSESAQSVH